MADATELLLDAWVELLAEESFSPRARCAACLYWAASLQQFLYSQICDGPVSGTGACKLRCTRCLGSIIAAGLSNRIRVHSILI